MHPSWTMKIMPVLLTYLVLMTLEQSQVYALSMPTVSRRNFITATAASSVLFTNPIAALSVSTSVDVLISELKDAKLRLSEVPLLLEQQEWDRARNILKTPPVNRLWNLGDSQNTLLKIAKESNNVELFELKDELASSIQMCDQLTYDNVFVYFQPGNGKINIKEPVSLAQQAIQLLQRAIEMASE